MWILGCDGESLKGKRIWLRPGKKYLFGRTKPETGRYVSGFAISHKSVSRKHLTISVDAVKPGDGTQLDVTQSISIKDEATKVGTEVDDVVLKDDTRNFTDGEHTIKLGSFGECFHLKWQPVVLTFTFPSKDTKNGKDPLVPIRSRLEDLGIKTILPYVAGATTHVVSTKRNTAKGLQALLHGGHIVENSFISAIVDAAKECDLNEPESFCPLEEDFNQYWPDALAHVPVPGQEPRQRPAELFAPDPGRGEIFAGLAFVFCDRKQFDNLQAPLVDGGGKAILFSMQQPLTTADNLEAFVKDTSSNGALTVLLVKFPANKGYEHWAAKLQEQVEQHLQHEFIEQNEFLDAILMNDPSTLIRKPSKAARAQAEDSRDESQRAVQSPQEDVPASAKTLVGSPLKSRRGPPKKAFKGFDDGFDISQIQPYKDEPSSSPDPAQPDGSRKRPHPEDDFLNDALLPGTAAVKKLKLTDRISQTPEPSAEPDVQPPSSHNKTPKKELDIKSAARDRRLAEEEAARRDEEDLHQNFGGMNFEEMNRLAKIVELDEADLREPTSTNQAERAQKASERWDPCWNGRKNFKKFKRAGERHGAGRREHTIIVPLEEVKKKGRGIGEHYWLETSSAKSRRERAEAESGQGEEGASPSHQTFTSAPSHQEEIPPELVNGQQQVVIDVDEPRATRQGQKRRASNASRGGNKKQRTFAVIPESDSEDEMKFRFRRKK